MQKLQGKLKNTPRNTSLVPCSVSSGLNKDQSPSDQSIVLTCNNSEENLRQHGAGSDSRVLNVVYVLNKRSLPLMPTCQSRARRLISNNKARIVKRYPFTIQLTIATGETRQKAILGVDAGYQMGGLSAVNQTQELISAELRLRNNIVGLLSERRMYRRNRRNKHHWYRKARFDNRTRPNGWLSPSMKQKADSHIRIIDKFASLVPVNKIKIETAKFDIQKINNFDIHGKEYQNGVQKDFENVREYVLYRDNHTCQHCKKTNLLLQVHHIISRKTGGNRPDNLVTLCLKCHEKHHRGKIKLDIKIKKDFRPEAGMSTMRKYIISELRKKYVVEETFGYITKGKRIENKIEKSHINDAFVIAGGNNQKRCGNYIIEQKRRNNRCLQTNRKGFAPSVRRSRYKIQPMDFVTVKGLDYIVKGIFNKGSYVRVVNKNDVVFNFKCNLVDNHFKRGSVLWN